MMGAFNGSWLLAILIFLAVGLTTLGVSLLVEWIGERRRRAGMADQLERLVTESLETLAPGAGELFRADRQPDSEWMQRLSAMIPRVRDLDTFLDQAALSWTVQRFLVMSGGMAVALGLAGFVATGSVLYAVIGAAAGGVGPFVHARRLRTKRLYAFEDQFAGAVELLGRAIRAGHPLSSGLKMVADEMPAPSGEEFRRVFEEQRFGLPFEDCLTAMADRVPLVDVRIFVTAVLIQREVGGNLTEILENLAGIIRQRATLQRQVRVITAEGRMGGYVLAALPVCVGIAFFFINREYIMTLFTHPMGRMMVGVALVMQTLGFLWIRRITTIEF